MWILWSADCGRWILFCPQLQLEILSVQCWDSVLFVWKYFAFSKLIEKACYCFQSILYPISQTVFVRVAPFSIDCSSFCKSHVTIVDVVVVILFDECVDQCLISLICPWGRRTNHCVWHLNQPTTQSINQWRALKQTSITILFLETRTPPTKFNNSQLFCSLHHVTF